MHSDRAMIRAAFAMGLLLLLGGAEAAAQTPPNAGPGSRTSEEAQSQPMANQQAAEPGSRQTGPAVPSAPAPAATAPGTGDYWYWIAAIVAVVAVIWGVPRVLRALGQSGRRR